MLMVLVAATSYGAVTPIVKMASLHKIPISWLTIAQYPLPIIFFLLMTGIVSRRQRPALTHPRLILFIGLAAAVTGLTYYRSVALLSPGFAILLLFQFAWEAPLLEWLFYGKKPSQPQWLGIAIILGGTLLAVPLGHEHWSFVGILWGLMAGLGYALTLVWSSRFSATDSPWPRALVSTTFGGVIVITVYHIWNLGSPPHAVWLWGALIGFFSQAIPLWLIYRNAPKLGAGPTAIVASAELPVAITLSRFLVGQPTFLVQWLGVTLILCGILVGSLPKPAANLD